LAFEGMDVPRYQHAALQAAVESELSRLVAEGGLNPSLAAGGAVPIAHAAHAPVRADGGPAQLGRQIATAAYGGFGR
jgi:hypothetical protein